MSGLRDELDQPRPRRSQALSLAGALIGAAIGIAVLAREGRFGGALPSEDAAVVNGVPILSSDLLQQAEAIARRPARTIPPAERRRVLDGMIADELRVQNGLAIDAPRRDSLVRAALVQATEGQIVADAMATVPTPAELANWFAAHRGDYADPGYMKVHEYILPPDKRSRATLAVVALRAGRSAASLGFAESGRLQGEDELYFAARLHLGPALFARAVRMRAGEVSDPIAQPDGYHVLAMVYNVGPRVYGYALAASKVRSDVMTDKTARLQRAGERYLRARADIRIAPALRDGLN